MIPRLLLGVLAVVALVATASGDALAEGREQGVEARVWSFCACGLAIDYERLFLPRLSATAGLGIRSSARGDYSGLASTLSLGARYWFLKNGPMWMSAPLGGPFAEGIVDVQRTSVRDKVDDESLPSTYTLEAGAGIGFRALVAQRVSVTVHLSQHLRADIPRGAGRTDLRTTLRYGLRLGVVF